MNTEKQVAKLTERLQVFNSNHRKETPCHFESYQVLDLDGEMWPSGELPSVVDLRIYKTETSVCACLWTRSANVSRQGSGKATGYGYHRASAAAEAAITNAGFDLAHPIHGRGDEDIKEAVLAVAKCLSVKRPALVVSHP